MPMPSLRPPTGFLTGLYLVAAGAERFLVEFVRAKDDRLIFGYTTAQLVAIVAVIAGVVIVVRTKGRSKKALAHVRPARVLGSHLP